MSATPGFFQSGGVRALLSRASRAAGVPVSVHFVMNGHEGPLVVGFGGCAACRHVAGISGGKAACRNSRADLSAQALKQSRAVADTCHLGFGVLTVPALAGEGYVLAFGPFVPAGGDASIAYDALHGLADVSGELLKAFPVSLEDIHRAPAGSVPAVAEWVVEELARLFTEWRGALSEVLAEATDAKPIAKAQRGAPINDARAIATAVAGGNRKRVRALLLGVAAEMKTRQRGARMLALLGEAIAACGKAGIDTTPTMRLLPEAALALEHSEGDAALAASALAVLAPLMRQPSARMSPAMQGYRELDRLLAARMPERMSVEEAAQALGKTPTAITRHLQRRFGMSFSEYQGRLRVERAKELLRRTQLSATAIAVRVGIDDQSNFGKLFRRHTGMTPLEYRAAHGKKRS